MEKQYKFTYLKNKFVTSNRIMNLWLFVLSIFAALCFIILLSEFFSGLIDDIELFLLLFIGFSFISFYMSKKCFNIISIALYKQFNYGFLGTDKEYDDCFLQVNDEYIKIYNDNIEYKFYYKNIKKYKISRNSIKFYHKKGYIIIPIKNNQDNNVIIQLKDYLTRK